MNDFAPFDTAFARSLAVRKRDLVTETQVVQLGARSIPWPDAPSWPEAPESTGLADDAIIETFLVDDGLTALSESPWLDAWRPRAQSLVDVVLAACEEHQVAMSLPGYLTCSITPVGLLEGNPHLDDDQLEPEAGIGIVAISGEHVGPRIADTPLQVESSVPRGPLCLSETYIEAFRAPAPASTAVNRPSAETVAIFGQFGQLHAGPAAADMPAHATHRQLMVLRVATN